MTTYTCPHCDRVGNTTKFIPPGARVKCPGCKQVFVPVPDDVDDSGQYAVSQSDDDVPVATTPPPLTTPTHTHPAPSPKLVPAGQPKRYRYLENLGRIWVGLGAIPVIVAVLYGMVTVGLGTIAVFSAEKRMKQSEAAVDQFAAMDLADDQASYSVARLGLGIAISTSLIAIGSSLGYLLVCWTIGFFLLVVADYSKRSLLMREYANKIALSSPQ